MSKVRQLSTDLSAASNDVIKLTERLKNLKRGTKEYADTVEKLNAANKRRMQIEKQLQNGSNGLIKGNKNHAKSIKEKTAAIKKSQAADKAYNKTQGKQQGIMARLTSTFGKRLVTLGKYLLATKILSAATSALSELFVNSAKRAIEFEAALANLGAIAGATDSELKNFAKSALDIANATKFSTTEIVGLQTEMTKLGFSNAEVIESSLEIANAAQAMGVGLTDTAAAVGKILNQFNLLTTDTEYITDVMVTTFNNSALSFETFGTAIQYVGPLAQQIGLDFQQVAGAMGILADNGFAASKIGTGLRNVFIELGQTGRPLEEVLKELYDSNLSLAEATDLVGKRSAAQLITLLDNIDAIEKSNDLYYQFGRTQEAAAQQMDTTQGRLQILGNAWNNLTRRIGESITQSKAYQAVVKGLLNLIDDDAYQAVLSNEIIAKLGGDRINQLNADLKAAGTELEKNKILAEAIAEVTDLEADRVLANFGLDTSKKINAFRIGLTEQYDAFILAEKEQQAALRGTKQATDEYADSVQNLRDRFNAGGNVNAEADAQSKKIREQIRATKAELEELGEAQVGEAESTRLTRIEKQKYLAELERQDNILASLKRTEEDIAGSERDRIKELIRIRKEALKDELEQLKGIRDAEIERAKSIEDQAEREAVIAAAQIGYAEGVSNAYQGAATDIEALSAKSEKAKEVIRKAVDDLQRQARITDSDGIKLFQTIFDNFQKAQEELNKLQRDGEISETDYNERAEALRDNFQSQIDSLITDLGIEGQAATVLRERIQEILNAPLETRKTKESDQNTLERLLGVDSGELDFQIEMTKKILADALGVFNDFGKEKLANLKAEADAELDVVRNRYKVEEEILKSQLDNQLITESQFRVKQQELRRAQIAEENAINKELFEQQKKQDIINATAAGLEAVAQSTILAFTTKEPFISAPIQAAISASAIAAGTAGKIGAISQRRFFPKKFEDGGMVYGPSHAEGGVPFTVQGQGGYEMEGGEFIINKRSASMHRELLERINNSGRADATQGTKKFALGGVVGAIGAAAEIASLEQLKQINANTSKSAINSDKPTRAYVSSKDLQNDRRERSIRNNNDRV